MYLIVRIEIPAYRHIFPPDMRTRFNYSCYYYAFVIVICFRLVSTCSLEFTVQFIDIVLLLNNLPTKLTNKVVFLVEEFRHWIPATTLDIIPFSMVYIRYKHNTVFRIVSRCLSTWHPVCEVKGDI